ncbi:hypothetical protein NBRC10513v2_004175 [Rhodotorula toruloides]
MSADEDLAKLSGWVSGYVKTYFPSVYDRFAKADPGQENPAHPFRCRYGIFPLFCLNYATNPPVHCVEQEDALAGKGQKPGSLVCYAQANYIVSREIGISLKRVKEKGLPTTYEGLYEHFGTEKGK